MQRTREREAKFHIEPDAAVPDLSSLPVGLRVVERPEIRLSARYFDTADLDLLRRGITLRHRRDLAGEGENLWTLKLPDGDEQVVLSRTELSWPGTDDDVPGEARRLLSAVLLDDDLTPVAAFVTVRHRREVHDVTGRRLAEVDDDRVTVTQPTGKVFRQIEVELDAGDSELISRLAKLLRRSGASRRDGATKLGLALSDRIAARAEEAPGAVPLTLGAVLQASITESLDKLVARDIGLRLERRAEDVHQARVACRRLRSDLTTFAPVLEADWLRTTSEELRWTGEVLGAVRDLDVLAARVAGHADDPDDPDLDGFAAVGVRIAQLRAAAWDRLDAALDSDRYRALLARLAAAAVAVPAAPEPEPAGGDGVRLSAPASSSLGVLVHRPWHRLRRTVRALPSHPSDIQLHRVRIRAKQLRYASELATPVIGARAKRLADAARQLQTELGDHHDAVVAEEALRGLVASLPRHGAFVAGRCAAAERLDAHSHRASWPAAWHAIDDKHLRRWLRP